MRRVVSVRQAPAGPITSTPTPSPTGPITTPTPTPTGTPTPEPTPTPSSDASLTRKVVSLGDPAQYGNTATRNANSSLTGDTINLVVTGAQCFNNDTGENVSTTICNEAGTSGPAAGDIITIPAVYNSLSRVVLIHQGALEALPGYANSSGGGSIASICQGTVILGPPSSRQTWSKTCDANLANASFFKIPVSFRDPVDYGSNNREINTNPDGLVYFRVQTIACINSETGLATSPDFCQNAPGPSAETDIPISAQIRTDLRRIVIDRAQLEAGNAAFMGTSTFSPDWWCRGANFEITTGGSRQNYAISCNSADATDEYKRYAIEFRDPKTSGATAIQAINTDPTGSLALAVLRTGCLNANSQQNVAISVCQFLSQGSNINDIFSIPASFRSDRRRILISSTDLMTENSTVYPVSANSPSSWCNKSIQINTGGQDQSWTTTCSSDDFESSFFRYGSLYSDPFDDLTTRPANIEKTQDLSFRVSTVTCVDLDTNLAVNLNNCQFLNEGPAVNGKSLITIPGTFVEEQKRIIISQSDLETVDPSRYATASAPGSPAWWCNGRLMRIQRNNVWESWETTCNADLANAQFTKWASHFSDPYSDTDTRDANISVQNEINFRVNTAACLNETNGTVGTFRDCQFTLRGPSVDDLVTIPATYMENQRRVIISANDFKTQQGVSYPSPSAPNGPDWWCGSRSIRVYRSNAWETWETSCDASFITANFRRVALSFQDPYGVSALRNSNQTATNTFSWAVRTTRCLDNDVTTIARSCLYLDEGEKVDDLVTVEATYNESQKRVEFRRSDIEKEPTAFYGVGSFSPSWTCNTTVKVWRNNTWETWGTRCI